MKLLLIILTFFSTFTLNLSAKPLILNESNKVEVSPEVVDEVIIENIDGKVLNDILIKYEQRVPFAPKPIPKEMEKEFENALDNFVESRKQLDSIMRSVGFKDILLRQLLPAFKEIFKMLWNHFISILDRIWGSANRWSERLFNRRLPLTYYSLAKSTSKQFGGYLCEKALIYSLEDNTEKAVNHCSTVMSSLNI